MVLPTWLIVADGVRYSRDSVISVLPSFHPRVPYECMVVMLPLDKGRAY